MIFLLKTACVLMILAVNKIQTLPCKEQASKLTPENETYIVENSCKNQEYLLAKPSSCYDLLKLGHKNSGIYTIYPKILNVRFKTEISVYCDMKTDGGGWTIFQRRDDYSVQENFKRDWEDYRNGFGNLEKDFWLGNEILHALTIQDYVTLRIDLEDFERNIRFAQYKIFKVSSCEDEFRLSVYKFQGDVADSLTERHNNSVFSTFDHDNKHNCSKIYFGGWWYGHCHHANLNGLYLKGVKENGSSVYWSSFNKDNYSLKRTEMKLRPAYF